MKDAKLHADTVKAIVTWLQDEYPAQMGENDSDALQAVTALEAIAIDLLNAYAKASK